MLNCVNFFQDGTSFSISINTNVSFRNNLASRIYCLEVYDENLCCSGVVCDTIKSGSDPCDTTTIVLSDFVIDESLQTQMTAP